MWPDSLVQQLMVLETLLLCKLPAAHGALKEALAGAPPKTDVEALLVTECSAAVRAHKGPLSIVDVHVLLEIVLVVSEVAAHLAPVLLAQLVHISQVVVPG